jgi:hypothetical protein
MDFSFLQAASSTTDTNAYTFAAQNLGAADPNRYIIVAAMARRAGVTAMTISSITVGGVAATIVVQLQANPTNTNIAGLAIAAVPDGTTGDVVVTFSQTMVRCGIALYRAVGISSATPTDTGSNAVDPISDTLNVLAGGFAIGCVIGGSGTTTVAWTNLTENYDANIESAITYSGASAVFPTEQTALAMTGDFSTSGGDDVGVFAAWGPLAGSVSPSVSPSLSPSISPSISPSVSPSVSPSPSPSGGAVTPSASPSAGYENYTKGNYASLPTGIADLENAYTPQEYTDVSSKNDERVLQSAVGEYAIHQFKDYVGDATSGTLEWEGQSNYAPLSSPVVLQIYNRVSLLWEEVDTDNTSVANTDFILTAFIANLTNYKDENKIVVCRVYQLGA